MSVACTRINNDPLRTRLLGNEKEPNVLNSIFHKRDGANFNQIANETNIVSPALQENWINVPTSRSQTGLHVRKIRSKTKHTLLALIQVRI